MVRKWNDTYDYFLIMKFEDHIVLFEEFRRLALPLLLNHLNI